MQDFDVVLPPGVVRHIHIQADYIYYRSGSAGGSDAAIEFAPQAGGQSLFLYPGQACRLPHSMRGVGSTWTMKNRKGEAQIIGQVILGEGEFQDNRISGSVEVISGEKARTLANKAFIGYGNAAATPTGNMLVQLYNPVGSGKVLFVPRIVVSSNTEMAIRLSSMAGALAAPDATWTPKSKLLGGGGSVASVLAKSNPGELGTPIHTEYLLAKQQKVILFTEPFAVPAGWGLMMVAASVNSDLPTNFEYYEDAI